MKNQFNWLNLNSVDVLKFANGTISGREFYALYKNTEKGGAVRNLLRERGVRKSRELARRAMQRLLKGVSV